MTAKNRKMKTLEGIGVSSGVAISPAYVVKRNEPIVTKRHLMPDEIEAEKKRFLEAVQLTREQLTRTQNIISKNMGAEQAHLIEAQIMLLSDKTIIDETLSQIESEAYNASYAFSQVIDVFLEHSEKMDNEFFKERLQEFRDIKRRVLSNILGSNHDLLIHQNESKVLVIDHLSPSETAQLFESNYKGLICEFGGETSHIAIMAKTMEIPTVLGVEEATIKINPDEDVIVDGNDGVVYASPDPSTLEVNIEKIAMINQVSEMLIEELDEKATTPDGKRFSVASNIELPDEVRLMKKYHSEGIGLFRTELLYITRKEFPSEDLQYNIYRRVIQQCDGELVIIRTFDIGGDKFSENFEHHLEPNPFLGWRAIRVGLDFPHVLSTQIRAILRASNEGQCAIMFPMISNIDEVREAIRMVAEAKEELRKKDIDFDDDIQIGIMVEVPSVALMADRIARYVDFMSIGTNDLIQYTLAADRGNEKVSKWYQSYNPAVLHLIEMTIKAAHDAGIWVGMCGQMAGKTLAIPLLIGMGIDELSVNPSQIPLVRGLIRRIEYKKAKRITKKALEFDSDKQVEKYLKNELSKILPENLMRFI
ncbi:MAG: phosphoenolpyruvate--protein phosphotransferase [Candidatus Zixiibacteriota bacterium]